MNLCGAAGGAEVARTLGFKRQRPANHMALYRYRPKLTA